MSRVYFYKVKYDSGAAPCVHGTQLSLAICKPSIRMTARKGDLVFGFAANTLDSGNRLVFVANVTDPVDARDYATRRRFEGRPDRIYRWDGKAFELRRDAKYHCEDGALEHDLGEAPGYRRARVLVSDEFRYFNVKQSQSPNYKGHFPALKRAVETLGQGHRVNHPLHLEKELLQLFDQVMRLPPTPPVQAMDDDPLGCAPSGQCAPRRSKGCG